MTYPQLRAFNENQPRASDGKFAPAEAASERAEQASANAGKTNTHRDAMDAHETARKSHDANSKRLASMGDYEGAEAAKRRADYHAERAVYEGRQSWIKRNFGTGEGNILGGRVPLAKLAVGAGIGALVGLGVRKVAGAEAVVDLQAFNESQPRDPDGKFASGQAGGVSAKEIERTRRIGAAINWAGTGMKIGSGIGTIVAPFTGPEMVPVGAAVGGVYGAGLGYLFGAHGESNEAYEASRKAYHKDTHEAHTHAAHQHAKAAEAHEEYGNVKQARVHRGASIGHAARAGMLKSGADEG